MTASRGQVPAGVAWEACGAGEFTCKFPVDATLPCWDTGDTWHSYGHASPLPSPLLMWTALRLSQQTSHLCLDNFG